MYQLKVLYLMFEGVIFLSTGLIVKYTIGRGN